VRGPVPRRGQGPQCLDDVRRQAWGSHCGLRYNLSRGDARRIQRSRWALWKNADDLTDNQRAKLAWIAKTSPKLRRAYLVKEALRWVFTVKGEAGKHALDRWLTWAQRCRIDVFVALGRKIKRHLPAIHATLEHERRMVGVGHGDRRQPGLRQSRRLLADQA
jgi:transposase